MLTSSRPWASKEAAALIPRASAEQHLVGPGECRPGEEEDSPGAAAGDHHGAVRPSRLVQPAVPTSVAAGGKLEVENIGQCRNL